MLASLEIMFMVAQNPYFYLLLAMLPLSNTAIHLTRHLRFTVPFGIFIHSSLRPGDGER